MDTDILAAGPVFPVGRFDVRTTPEEVARFGAVVGGDMPLARVASAVPICFPVTWLGRGDISAALKAAAASWAAPDRYALVHLAQTISVSEPLQVGTCYLLDLVLSPPDGNGTMRITAGVLDEDNRTCATLSGEIALVPTGSRT